MAPFFYEFDGSRGDAVMSSRSAEQPIASESCFFALSEVDLTMARKKPKSLRAKKSQNSQKTAVLFRPERRAYVRGERKARGCVFCQALATGPSVESLLLYETVGAIVIMNKYPYNSGHLLVLPRRHCGDFLALTAEEHGEISHCLSLSIRALTEVYKPAGFNAGLNLGAASGAGIPEHLHYHVIPRWNGDTNFFPLIAKTKVVIETLEQTYEKLARFFASIKKGV